MKYRISALRLYGVWVCWKSAIYTFFDGHKKAVTGQS